MAVAATRKQSEGELIRRAFAAQRRARAGEETARRIRLDAQAAERMLGPGLVTPAMAEVAQGILRVIQGRCDRVLDLAREESQAGPAVKESLTAAVA